MKEHVQVNTEIHKADGEVIDITVKGDSEIPFFHDDLWFKAAIQILERMDYKEFFNEGKHELYNEFVDELKEISDRMSSGDW